MKRRNPEVFATAWMNLEGIILREYVKEDKYYMVSMWNLWEKKLIEAPVEWWLLDKWM